MIHHGDLFDVLPSVMTASIDAVITDPPYGIGFMNKKWDTFKQGNFPQQTLRATTESSNPNLKGRTKGIATPSAIEYDRSLSGQKQFEEWCEKWAAECYRVMKPGAYLLSCGAPRSAHRMISGIENAGFEIRDTIAWIFGSGFPKSLNVGRMIDMEVCTLESGHNMHTVPDGEDGHVCPITELGRHYAGYGTGLKPAFEPIVVARKPLDLTVAMNMVEYGTGALNIDAGRVEGIPPSVPQPIFNSPTGLIYGMKTGEGRNGEMSQSTLGRWPANLIFDDFIAEKLEESKFFYVAKPSRAERDEGLHNFIKKTAAELTDRKPGSKGLQNPRAGIGAGSRNRDINARVAANHHPTVKPIVLMQYLVRLVAPEDGVVLDPFCGSGTTGIACKYEGRKFIGIEREAEYVEIAKARIAAAAPLFGED